MTYQEIQDRLSKCESTLKKLKSGNYSKISQEKTKLQVEKLTTLRESLQKQLKEADGTVSTADPNQAEKLADKGLNVKLVDKDELSKNEGGFNQNETAKIAAGVGKAVVLALNEIGENISKARVINIKPDRFSVRITFKNDNEDVYEFYINEDDRLMLVNPSYDRDIADVGVNPSGAVINIDVVKDAFAKELKSIMAETELPHKGIKPGSEEDLENQRYSKLSKREQDTIKKIKALIDRERKLKNTKEEVEYKVVINGKEVDTDSIEIAGVDRSQGYDDGTVDAYAEYAMFKDGSELSYDELEQLTDSYSDLIHDLAIDSFHESTLKEGEYAADKYNVNVFGYQTKYFKICPGAKSFMDRVLAQQNDEENKEEIIRLAKLHDLLFLYEIRALKDSKYAAKILNQAEYLASTIKDQVENMGLNVADVDYLDSHIEKIKDAAKGIKEGEGDDHHYIKVPRAQYKKAQRVIDDVLANDVYGGHKHDIVDNDGRGNVVFYFMGPEERAITYDAVVYLRNSDIDVVDSSVDDIEELRDTVDNKEIEKKVIEFAKGGPLDIRITYHRNKEKVVEDITVEKAIEIIKKFIKQNDLTQANISDESEDILLIDDGNTSIDLYRDGSAKYNEAELSKAEKSKLKDMSKSLKKSSKGHAGQAKYIDKLVKEGRGDMDIIKGIIRDRANESGFEEREEAAEVIAGIAEEYKLNLKMIQNYMDDDGPVNPFDVNEGKVKPATYAGRAVVVHMNGPETNWKVEFIKSGKTVDYADVISNLKFDDDTTPTDYMQRRRAEKDYMQEDMDVGHQDDEPSMLKSTAYESAAYAAKLYKKLAKYDQFDGEVDFPNWWQSKLILAKDYLSKAFHYIDSKEKQPMIDKLALENKQVKESPEQEDAVNDLRNIVDQLEELGEEARDLVRQFFPNELSRLDGYRAFEFAYSSNRYDTTLGKFVDRLEDGDYDDLDDDDYPREGLDSNLPKGKHSIGKLQKAHGMIVDKMKELAKLYKEKGGEHEYRGHSVIDHLKSLTRKKKQVEDALNKAVSDKNRGQQLDPNVDEKAPGYKHDCAAKVVHEKYGKGNCIPEKHTLVKEGNKYVVTHYDVLFESGKTVTDIPVSELDIKTSNEHWHKNYKKKGK